MSVDVGLIRGLLTALLFAAFIGLCIWAWSKSRKTDFERAAQLPLEDGVVAAERKEQQS